MPKVTVSLYGRDYQLACAAGEEARVRQLAAFVDQKMHAVAAHAGNTTEPRLFMLACLMMADEIMELRERRSNPRSEDVEAMMGVVARMQDRVAHLAAAGARV